MQQPDVFLVVAFDHPLQAVESVADRIASALSAQGVNAAACSLPRDAGKLAGIPPQQISGILSMGSLPLSHRVGGEWLWERVSCPVTIYLLDAILYDLARVPVLSEFLAAAQQDRRLGLASPEAGYLNWMAQGLGVRWDHLPFGHFAKLQQGAEPVVPQPRLCVIGTIGQELGGGSANESLPALLQRVGLGAATDDLHDVLTSPDADAVPARAISHVLGWGLPQVLKQLPALIAVDSWVKRQRRIAAVRSLQGLPVDFYGAGWKEVLGDVPDFRHVGQVRHGDIATVLPHYRGVVNFDPNWSHGVHDRVYTAAAMGVPVLTNQNEDLARMALPESLVWAYPAQQPDLANLVESARLLSSAPEPVQPRADVLQAHSWANRVAPWICL
jgi:hypothetical protein